MATTRPKTIKLTDFADVVDKAVQASAGKRLPGGIIFGRMVPKELAAKMDVNAIARDITAQVAGSVSDGILTPKVVLDGGFITIGFIFKPVELNK